MAERKLEALTHREKQALRWYGAQASRVSDIPKKDLQKHLDTISNPDHFGEICEAYERSKSEQRIYEGKQAALARAQKAWAEQAELALAQKAGAETDKESRGRG